MMEETKKIAEFFQCGYKIFKKGSEPDKLEDAYYKAFEEGKEKGLWPVILVIEETWTAENFIEEYYGDGYDREKLIQECGDNGKELLEEVYNRYIKEYYDDEEELIGRDTYSGYLDFDEDEYYNEEEDDDEEYDDDNELNHFCSYLSYNNEDILISNVLLLEVPVKNPWEIIAWFPFGGWNECPMPEDMIAICKYWYKAYGAVPAVFTSDIIEFYAPDKIKGADSIETAKEHFAFCTDRVLQGTMTYTLAELADCIENSTVWYFWWD